MEKPTMFRTVLLYCLMFGVVAAVLMLAWNRTMTDLFQFPEVDYLHALGLLLISRILFGGEGVYFKRKFEQCFSSAWKQRIDSMPEAEREELRRKWEERCGKLNN
ncbi:MAG: hypothetical protein ACKORE_07405 [Bacteroidota bacterium]